MAEKEKKPASWTLDLGSEGFAGVTFSKRNDVKYGIRPMPYYEIDGDLEILNEIKNQLFKYGINSTLMENKYFNSLQVVGIDNCLTLCDILGMDDGWSQSLKAEFKNGKHLTPDGIKKLHIKFGKKSLLSYEEVCAIVDAAREKHLNEILKKIFAKERRLHLLPLFDKQYNEVDVAKTSCMQCGKIGVKIYFVGRYPRKDNTFFLCDECFDKLDKPFPKAVVEQTRKKIYHLHNKALIKKHLQPKELCEVCGQYKACHVYGIKDDGDDSQNISLCTNCRAEWYERGHLYRPESVLEDIISYVLYEEFPEYFYIKKQVGKLIPDFVFPEQKKVIEVFGCYWHACPIHFPEREIKQELTYEYRARYFAEQGYETLVIWEHDFEHEDLLIQHIRNFFLIGA